MENERLLKAFSSLAELVTRLRGANGCPWDAQQTDNSIKLYLLEEAYEVLDAVENGTPQDLCQELGDLLFQIIFLTSLAQDRGDFDLVDVIENIVKKMINRHPHVFGTVNVNSPEEVSDNWEKIKRAEKGSPQNVSTLLRDVPIHMPALMRANRLSQRAAKVGFDWKDKEEIFEKVKEEFRELEQCIQDHDTDRFGEEVGDLFFSLVNLTRHWGLNSEHLMREANQKFIRRFKEMEDELNRYDIDIYDATPEEMNIAWEKIKITKE